MPIINEELITYIKHSFPVNSNWNISDDACIPVDGEIERIEINKDFKNRTWLEISDNTISYHNDSLFVFKDESFVYYLPSYIMFVASKDRSGHVVFESIQRILHPEIYKIKFNIIKKSLTNSQKIAIARFLNWMCENYEQYAVSTAEEAIEMYWKEFVI
jgi:hypothetical protein